jgi:hypothetical protein
MNFTVLVKSPINVSTGLAKSPKYVSTVSVKSPINISTALAKSPKYVSTLFFLFLMG